MIGAKFLALPTVPLVLLGFLTGCSNQAKSEKDQPVTRGPDQGRWEKNQPVTTDQARPEAQDRAAVVKKLAQQIADWTLQGDFAKLIDHTINDGIAATGSRARAISQAEAARQFQKAQGIAIEDYSVGDPGEFVTQGNETFVVVPTIQKTTSRAGKLTTKSYLLGISRDHGKNWVFAEGAFVANPESRRRFLPALPAGLTLPDPDIPGLAENEQTAGKAIRKLGGAIFMDSHYYDSGEDPFTFRTSIEWVSLAGASVTDTALASLKELKKLRRVDLNGSKITDQGLRELKDLSDLRHIDLSNTKITDVGLAELKDLKRLQTLRLWQTQVTDAAMMEVGELTNLQHLSLWGTKVTDSGMKEIKGLKKLTWLELNGTGITDKGLKELKELQNLQTLWLQGTLITDAGLVDLKELKSVKDLNLKGTQVTDAGLEHFNDLKNLWRLDLRRTKVTDASVRQLRAKMPKVQILCGQVD